MSRVKVELIRGGVRQLLYDPALSAMCEEKANQIVSSAGGDYDVETKRSSTRTVVQVSPGSIAQYHKELKHNYLYKAMKGMVIK